MSQFDMNNFLDATTTEAGTRRPPLPAGDYKGIIKPGTMKVSSGVSQKNNLPWNRLDFQVEIDLTLYPEAKEVVGQDKVILFEGVMMQLTPQGAIDWSPGQNGSLRRYREALDQNTSGQPWAPRHMEGRPILVKVKQDPNPVTGDIVDRIETVAKAA